MRTISRDELLVRLRSENPWWGSTAGDADPYSELEPRGYIRQLLLLLEKVRVRRAVVLMGPRRVGKTVMLHHAISELMRSGIDPRTILYVSLDQPLYNSLSLDDIPELHRDAAGMESSSIRYAVFDEIQYLRDWERHLKLLVDRNARVKFVTSGSAAAALRLRSQELDDSRSSCSRR